MLHRLACSLLPQSCRGCTTVLILLIFYSAPLSALAEVFRTRSSASLYLPFAAMNVVNGLLWTTYGLALGDSFIYGPNMVRSAGQGVVHLLLGQDMYAVQCCIVGIPAWSHCVCFHCA
jgi:hypothetical protein